MTRRVTLLFSLLVLVGCTDGITGAIPDLGPTTSTSSTTLAPTTTTSSTTTTSTTTTTTIPTAFLNVTVVDTVGSPVPGAVVTAGSETVTTGPDGMVALGPIPISDVAVDKPGWVGSGAEWDGGFETIEVTIEPRLVRALRVSAYVAADPAMYESLLDLTDETAVNALVFDTKQEGGTVLYETSVEEAHRIGAVKPMYDPVELLNQAKDRGLYTVTRVVSFEDDVKARAVPEHKLAGAWIDPRIEEAWEYPLALAVEACEFGFDEIQFDYVRFPTGRAAEVSGQRDMTEEERVSTIEAYLAEAKRRLHPMGCAVSADIFGIVVSSPDDQGIGQKPEELSRQLDAVSPMVYPSHYSDGWLGFADPNDHPYAVTADAIDDSLPRLEPGSVLRPWLQGFWWSSAQIRASIQAAEDRGVGWIIWNAPGNYSKDALPTDEDLAETGPDETTTTTVPEATTTTTGG